jgi:hypothetical protein
MASRKSPMIADYEIPMEVIQGGDVDLFIESMDAGNSERFATMCAMRQAPGLKGTDTQNDPFPNMPPRLKQHYWKEFRKRGINPTGGVYKTGLVRPGYGGVKPDFEALVFSTADVKRVVEKNNWSSEGMVEVQGDLDRVSDEVKPFVSESIVSERTADEVIANHGGRIKKKDYNDLKDKVRKRLLGNTDGI